MVNKILISKKPKFILFILLIYLVLGSHTVIAESVNHNDYNHYTLNFRNLSSRTIEVTAELEMDGDKISIHEDSLWSIVSIKSIQTKFGQNLAIKKYDGNSAFIEKPLSGSVKIIYDINFSFIDQPMLNANTGAGKAFDDGLFVVAKALFIFSDKDKGAIVSIKRPKDLHVTLSWKSLGDSWFADNYYDLTQANVIVTTTDATITIPNEKIEYSLVALSLDEDSVSLIENLGENVANFYIEQFPLKREARFLQLIFAGREPAGEAYPSGTSISLVTEDIENIHWRLMVAHELFHLWLPHSLKVVERELMEWFSEGFTNYVSEQALYETGYIDEIQLADLRLKNFARAKDAFKSVSGATNILESGKDKFRFNDIVYAGGGVVAAWLDNQLIQKFDGEWNLILFLAHLFEKYSSTEIKFDLEIFLSELSILDEKIARNLDFMIKTKDWSEIETMLGKALSDKNSGS